jgi:hypothetical protein
MKTKTPRAKAIEVEATEMATPDQLYKVSNRETVKRGSLLGFVEFAEKKGAVTVAELTAEFKGRQIDGHKVTPKRVRRYISYCVSHDIFKTVDTR